MIRHNVDCCKIEPRFMPLSIYFIWTLQTPNYELSMFWSHYCSEKFQVRSQFIAYLFQYNGIYYIPINVISLGTVDFTECDPMLQITTLWFSESISPLSETDDAVHNVFLSTNAWGIVTSFISYRTKYVQRTLSVSKWSLQILLLSINASFWCILNDFQLITSLRG